IAADNLDRNGFHTLYSIFSPFSPAVNMQFYEKIKISTIVNIDATATEIFEIIKFIYSCVSTIYSNCHVKHIEERLYSYLINHKHLITFARNLPENIFEEKISKISSQWPNTYTFTKAIAEGLFKNESGDLPTGIFRPAINIASAWDVHVHNQHGFLLFNTNNIFYLNTILCSRRVKDILIYNFVPPINGPTWKEYAYALLDINKTYPNYYQGMRLYQLNENDSMLKVSRMKYGR
ncbi:hypothetical protein ALC53_01396, partial [Atta colombica]